MIGVDLVYIPEFKKQLKLGKNTLLQKAFTDKEKHNQKPEHLAGLWAAKEAVIKALGGNGILLEDIEIKYSPNGQPIANVKGKTIEISIAHHGDYAVAVAQVPTK